jgi:hypothetical protein
MSTKNMKWEEITGIEENLYIEWETLWIFFHKYSSTSVLDLIWGIDKICFKLPSLTTSAWSRS